MTEHQLMELGKELAGITDPATIAMLQAARKDTTEAQAVEDLAQTIMLSWRMADLTARELEMHRRQRIVAAYHAGRGADLLVALSDLARITGVAEKTIRNKKNLPKPTRKRGRAFLYRYSEIAAWWPHQKFRGDLPPEDEARLTVRVG